MQLIDTHCHLTALKHAPLSEIIANAKKAFVSGYLCIGAGSGPDSAQQAFDLAEANQDIWASVGVHPHDAGEKTDVSDLQKFFESPRVVAVGETGLDFYRDWSPQEKQYELFENTIVLAKLVKKPLIIHCRSAATETFEVLKRHHAEDVGGVFHCYAEDSAFAKKLRDINFIVSFPGSLTFKSANALRQTAKDIPLEQIMLETDAPYMAPEPFRGKPSEPMHVWQIAKQLSQIKGISIEEVAEQTCKNAVRLFGLPGFLEG